VPWFEIDFEQISVVSGPSHLSTDVPESKYAVHQMIQGGYAGAAHPKPTEGNETGQSDSVPEIVPTWVAM